jgi:hypothetical protein
VRGGDKSERQDGFAGPAEERRFFVRPLAGHALHMCDVAIVCPSLSFFVSCLPTEGCLVFTMVEP